MPRLLQCGLCKSAKTFQVILNAAHTCCSVIDIDCLPVSGSVLDLSTEWLVNLLVTHLALKFLVWEMSIRNVLGLANICSVVLMIHENLWPVKKP